jgi:multidrug efflux pump subunit AcrB
LQEIAQVKTVWQYPKIIRRELERTITVGAYLKPGYNAADIFEQTEPWIKEQSVASVTLPVTLVCAYSCSIDSNNMHKSIKVLFIMFNEF